MMITADFNDVEDDDMIWVVTSQGGRTLPQPEPREGDWVELSDHDGMTCLAQVREVIGNVIRCRIDWASRRIVTQSDKETPELLRTMEFDPSPWYTYTPKIANS